MISILLVIQLIDTESFYRRVLAISDTFLYKTFFEYNCAGKWFGGFDCVNGLITKGLIKREATEQPT